MVNELMDLSLIESGVPSVVRDDVDLGRLAGATVERARLFAERQGITLAIDAPSVVPVVRGDGERLGQALLNLLHNAVKFSPAGSTVVVRVTPAESEVVVAVEDHGQGIPRSALPRIFERFYKVDRARTRGAGGTGLGLSIARHVVEAHGGRIWVESEEGAGSSSRSRSRWPARTCARRRAAEARPGGGGIRRDLVRAFSASRSPSSGRPR